jgi:DNA-binding MarR family transcriptional regulator/GNAT superfamily N-acetyltransferase
MSARYPVVPAHAAALRRFSRDYTRTLGLLSDGILQTEFSLAEARVLYELGQTAAGVAVADLRHRLGLDRGYLSRILGRFEAAGLITRLRSDTDRRRQVVALTDAGRDSYELLDRRSQRAATTLLTSLDAPRQQELVGALDHARSLLRHQDTDAGRVELRVPQPGDLGWIVERHGALYASTYGWDRSFEALVARIVADFANGHDAARERAWIATVDGRRAGCIFCVTNAPDVAQLRLLLVEPWARGRGVGSRLVSACLEFARAAGYGSIRLWTNDVLVEARRIYERAGFELESEEPHHSFGHDLVGQIWRRTL